MVLGVRSPKLAQEGVQKIAVHYLTRRNEAEKTLALLRDAGGEGVLVQGDTSNAERAREIVDEAARNIGQSKRSMASKCLGQE